MNILQRYFVDREYWLDEQVVIKGDDYHHIVNVMRMKVGDEVICNHPDKEAYLCSIDRIDQQAIYLNKINHMTNQVELPVDITLIQGLPKGDKLEWIVQKSTELGVKKIIPLNTARSVVKWDAKKQAKKIERLKKIAKEASEQSHRTDQPIIESLMTIKQLSAQIEEFDHLFVAYEETTRQIKTDKLYTYLEDIKPGQSVAIVIGPEGGLTEKEIAQLYAAQFKAVRLGPRILRTETAPLYFLSVMSLLFEES